MRIRVPLPWLRFTITQAWLLDASSFNRKPKAIACDGISSADALAFGFRFNEGAGVAGSRPVTTPTISSSVRPSNRVSPGRKTIPCERP